MSFFSRSSKRKPYKYGYHGNRHYQRRGLFDKLFHIMRSGSYSGRHYYPPNHGYPPHPPAAPHAPSAVCTECRAQIPAGSKFCLECGAKVAVNAHCVNCGQQVPAGAKFCPNCGQQQ